MMDNEELLAWLKKTGAEAQRPAAKAADNPMAGLMRAIAPVVADHVAKVVAPLAARIAELENRPVAKYVGVFEIGRTYEPGNFATDKGAIWHCNATTRQRPGDNADWTLAVKSGQR
jgi:hypothetical protein